MMGDVDGEGGHVKGSRICGGLVLAMALVGCGGGAAGGGAPAPSSEQEAGDGSAVVLRVEDSNAMVAPRNRLNFLPKTSVYADGRVVQEVSPTLTSIDRDPALPALVQRTLTPAGLDALVERARAAEVGSGADLGDPPVMDAPTTHFTLTTERGTVSTDAYALGISAGQDGIIGEPVPSPSIPVGSGRDDGTLTAEQAGARYRLLDLTAALDDLAAALGEQEVGPQEAYRPQALAVLAAPAPADEPPGEPVPWPGPALPVRDGTGGGGSCTVVRGADLAPVLDAAGQARRWTPWTDGGRTWLLAFRPLLPDEDTCEDLTRQVTGT